MKPLKFDPIEVPRDQVRGSLHVSGYDAGMRHVAIKNGGGLSFDLYTASETAALIAALQVAHKAQLEAETLTFSDLKPGEWFRFSKPHYTSPNHICVKVSDIDYQYQTEADARLFDGDAYDVTKDRPVIRLTATFTEVKP